MILYISVYNRCVYYDIIWVVAPVYMSLLPPHGRAYRHYNYINTNWSKLTGQQHNSNI